MDDDTYGCEYCLGGGKIPDDGNCPKCGSYHPPDEDQAGLDARDAEFDDRWNARMNP
jgi:hypothetical protein